MQTVNSKYSALVRKNGRLQWLPVPGCISASEAREQAEKMYSGDIQMVVFEGPDRQNKSQKSSYHRTESSSEYSEGSFLGMLILLGIALVITIIANFWQYILVGVGLAIFAYIMHLKKS